MRPAASPAMTARTRIISELINTYLEQGEANAIDDSAASFRSTCANDKENNGQDEQNDTGIEQFFHFDISFVRTGLKLISLV
jgi:hypothetical protein